MRREPAGAAADRLARALQSISPQSARRGRLARRLLGRGDPFDGLVPARLLDEGFARTLEAVVPDSRCLVVAFDRLGGAEGAAASTGLLRILAARCTDASFVHVAFNTPSRGIGALIRAGLTRTGAELGIPVEVVAHDRPAWALKAAPREVDDLFAGIDVAIVFAPQGAAGLVGDPEAESRRDPLLERTHLAVLSFPDPEALVADLDRFAAILAEEPGIDSVRFWVQAEDASGRRELGHALLADPGDALERLWVLLDNARRHRYRVLVEPMARGLPAGDPLVCPCRTAVQDGLRQVLEIERVVAAGGRILVTGRGRHARQGWNS
jgi:hypothetical protein